MHRMLIFNHILLSKPFHYLSLFVFLWSLSPHNALSSEKKTLSETIPSTVANINGQKTLYKEGWFIISSTEKAFTYAKEHSVDKSYEAINRLLDSLGDRTDHYQMDLQQDIQASTKTVKDFYQSGTNQTARIFKQTHSMGKTQLEFSADAASKAWNRFSNGYIYLGARTAESRASLASLPGGYAKGISDDFSELVASIKAFNNKSSLDIKKNWVNAFSDAQSEFQQAYVDSGEKSNSASGLWTLLGGYASSLWEGLFKPTVKTTWDLSVATVVIAGEAIFLPVASTYILTKNTIQSTGMAIYYVGKTGIEVISPTIEGGFLASMSLLSAGTVPVTYVAGSSVGVINQVATTLGAPVAGVTHAAVSTTVDTVKYGTLVTYDAVTATTKVFINQVQSGVVLGYNALTAIPSQLLLTSLNSAYFIVMDGPKLAIASIQGRVSLSSNSGEEFSEFDSGNLPVGTVIDLKTLQQSSNANIQIITEDTDVINNVLDQLSKDLKK